MAKLLNTLAPIPGRVSFEEESMLYFLMDLLARLLRKLFFQNYWTHSPRKITELTAQNYWMAFFHIPASSRRSCQCLQARGGRWQIFLAGFLV